MNILPVLGACVSLPDLIIVSQFMHYGSLYNVLHEQSDLIIDLNQAILAGIIQKHYINYINVKT